MPTEEEEQKKVLVVEEEEEPYLGYRKESLPKGGREGHSFV